MRLRSAMRLMFVLLIGVVASHGDTVETRGYHVPEPDQPEPAIFVAGAYKKDITPPAGYPLGGHSWAAPSARGAWMRLYARAFYLRDSHGNALALVSCDLFALPGGLHAKVLESLASQGLVLAPSNLLIAATHTHQGPGNYLTSAIYNKFASNSEGFDRQLFTFLVGQITQAILDAQRDANQAATLPHWLVFHSGSLCRFARNRAPDSFEQDADREEMRESERRRCPTSSPFSRYRAIDSTLRVVDIVRLQKGVGNVVGTLIFFAVHPTTMSHDAAVYSPDFPGYAMALIEKTMPPGGVAAFFNGAEGDVSPAWLCQNRKDLEELGTRFANAVIHLRSSPGEKDDSPQLAATGQTFEWKELHSRGGNAPSLTRPEFGLAALGGAEDGRSFLYNLGCRGGVTDACGPEILSVHLSTIAKMIQSPRDFPTHIPLSIVRLGNRLALLVEPFEMTTMAGYRLRKAMKARLNSQDLALVGLANEYLSYMTTPEEFGEHAYEGASTVFGSESSSVILELFIALAKSPARCPPCDVPPLKFHTGAGTSRLGPKTIAPRNAVTEDLDMIFPDETNRLDGRVVYYEWKEGLPSDLSSDGSRKIQILRNGTLVADQESADLVVVANGAAGNSWQIAAVWLPAHAQPTDEFQFVVTTPEHRVCESFVFRLPAPSPNIAGACH